MCILHVCVCVCVFERERERAVACEKEVLPGMPEMFSLHFPAFNVPDQPRESCFIASELFKLYSRDCIAPPSLVAGSGM